MLFIVCFAIINQVQALLNIIYTLIILGIINMNINYNREFRGPARANKLQLKSQRFQQPHISKNAKKAVDYVKEKDRSYLKSHEWREKSYYKSDATIQLKECPDDIDRVESSNLTVAQFVERYEKPIRPVIIRGCTKDWNLDKWNFEAFYEDYKDSRFKIGEDDQGYKLRAPLKYYFQYLIHNKDDSPLYLFESSIEDHKQAYKVLDNYKVPCYFKDDLFKLAGQKKRPPYRWLIIGPQRSGTTVHTDPLNTSAWNTSLQGYKRWVTFGSNVPKTIVKGKEFRPKNYEDEAINYFVEILPKIKQKYSKQELDLKEFIQGPGQTVFVPGGIWHAVMNLEDTIAVTQNVMTHHNFTDVWRSTRCERPKFAQKFLQDLKAKDNQLYERAIRLNEQDQFTMGQRYCKQSVSLSFSSSSRSSSSSSSSSSSASQSYESNRNKVEVKERRFSCSRSRSRERKNNGTRSEEKKTHESRRA